MQPYERKASPLQAALYDILARTGRPMKVEEVEAEVEAAREFSTNSVRGTLSKMAKQEAILRVQQGVYALPEPSTHVKTPEPEATEVRTAASSSPVIGIAMGSESDLPTMQAAAIVLAEFDVPFEMRVLSAHRTPDRMTDYAKRARERGLKVIVAGAGGAAHLPGMIAASTTLPVIGVPVPTRNLKGLDSLLSIVQMPGGVPVATVAIGQAKNAGLLAVQILATADDALARRLADFRAAEVERVKEMDTRVRGEG